MQPAWIQVLQRKTIHIVSALPHDNKVKDQGDEETFTPFEKMNQSQSMKKKFHSSMVEKKYQKKYNRTDSAQLSVVVAVNLWLLLLCLFYCVEQLSSGFLRLPLF